MSGFIAPTGLDLDLIFQPTPTTETTTVSSTGFRVNDANQTTEDLAIRYRQKKRNTYTSQTGFKTTDNKDLMTLFEWGGYTPSFGNITLTKSGLTASIEVTGNYYTVDISGASYVAVNSNDIIVTKSDRVTTDPFKLSHTANYFGSSITFRISIYNGFRTGSTAKFVEYTVNTSMSDLPEITNVNLISASSNTLTFSFIGLNYSNIRWAIGTANATTSTPTSSSIVSVPITQNVTPIEIIFTPINQFNEDGQTTTITITYETQIVEYSNFLTTLYQDTPKYLYKVDLLVVGAGGSGGVGGNKTTGGVGGGGGGGGSGGYRNDSEILFDGTITTKNVSYTCGKGGTEIGGVNGHSNGTDGLEGTSSTITIVSSSYTAGGGAGGIGGARNGNPGTGGIGGTPNGFKGGDGNNGGNGIAGTGGIYDPSLSVPIINPVSDVTQHGAGSDGGGGASGGGSGKTKAGGNGFARATFYYVVMT